MSFPNIILYLFTNLSRIQVYIYKLLFVRINVRIDKYLFIIITYIYAIDQEIQKILLLSKYLIHKILIVLQSDYIV